MSANNIAVAICRVSSVEQLQNNSLARQKEAVLRAAKELGVTIPDDAWWSGSVSSKNGTNTKRKDLREIVTYIKRHKNVSYVIVDEPDRFMRSIDEAAYFEVMFRDLGVKVWYASNPGLNGDDIATKIIKFSKFLTAEGSNEERSNKSINGLTKAFLEGRYPSGMKPGYMKGKLAEIHPVLGPCIKAALCNVASELLTPTEALKELNSSDFASHHATIRMDKFRKILIDPYYAGLIFVDKLVKVSNVPGQHEPLITIDQHEAIKQIVLRKHKTQKGPARGGNPDFPFSSSITCIKCDGKPKSKLVGYWHSNGKKHNPSRYGKYRCFSCGRYYKREMIHEQIKAILSSCQLDDTKSKQLRASLVKIWKGHQQASLQEAMRLRSAQSDCEAKIQRHIDAVTDPANEAIKPEIIKAIHQLKRQDAEYAERITAVTESLDINFEHFICSQPDYQIGDNKK